MTLTFSRFYRGSRLHYSDGPPTGPDNPPVLVERATLCGLRLSGRWVERGDPRHARRKPCPRCAAAAASLDAVAPARPEETRKKEDER